LYLNNGTIGNSNKMAKRSMKFLLIFMLMSFESTVLLAQTSPFKSDTVYVIICYGTLNNGRPVVTEVIQKDLNFFENYPTTSDQDTFMCEFFKHSILFVDPFLTLNKNYKKYNFSEKQIDSFRYVYNKKLGRLNKSYRDFKSVKFSNGKRIIFSVSKIAGEFWLVKTEPDNIYPVSESFDIDNGCYKYNYLYNLKEINSIIKLNEDELKTLSTQE
jgi:hypothetical protein